MPLVTAFIDDMRAAFGADEINTQIRAGLRGEPTFHASENGIEVGTCRVSRGTEISAADMIIPTPTKKEAAHGRA